MPVMAAVEKTLVTPPRDAVTTPSESVTTSVSAALVPLSVSFPPLTLATLLAAVFALNDADVPPYVAANATPPPALRLLVANAPALLVYLIAVNDALFAGLNPPVRYTLSVPASVSAPVQL